MVTLLAPAKINLSLKLLKKREDGFHELKTLMAPLSLTDKVEIMLNQGSAFPKIRFFCNDHSLPTGAENLCVQAALAFQRTTGITESLTITLLKQVPHGAGLGGGSSDAAAVLRGMNQLFQKPLASQELQTLAASLGSDAPFFLEPQTRWCYGRGELLGEPVTLPPWKLLLIKPPFPVSTAWAYKQVEECRERRIGEEKKYEFSSSQGEQLIDNIEIVNDLEEPVFKKYLLLPILKTWLQERLEVRAAWMSGSGSTMVALLQENLSPERIALLQNSILAEFGKTFWLHEATFFQKE